MRGGLKRKMHVAEAFCIECNGLTLVMRLRDTMARPGYVRFDIDVPGAGTLSVSVEPHNSSVDLQLRGPNSFIFTPDRPPDNTS